MSADVLRKSSLVLGCFLLSNCLPAYTNKYQEDLLSDGATGDGSDAGICPASTGKFLNGRVFSWGPAAGMRGYKSGIIGNVVGYDCLQSNPSTTIRIRIPAPQAVMNDGLEHYVDLRGMDTSDGDGGAFSILHMMYGPYVFTDQLLANSDTDTGGSSYFMHAMLDQPGNLRDTLATEIGAKLGKTIKLGTDFSWIYGSFLDLSGNAYSGSAVTVVSPPEAVSACAVYYTCEFDMGGPCADGGKFLRATSDGYGLFAVTCPKTIAGPITMSATPGTDTINSITKNFNNITVPLAPGPDDVVFPEWRP